MIDTSLIVDAALRKSQMLLDNLLSLDLMHEKADLEIVPPRVGHEFDEFVAEQLPVHEPPAHAREQQTVQVPVETLQLLTEVFEQVKAWQESSEHANLVDLPMSGQPGISKHDGEEVFDSESMLTMSTMSTEGSLRSSPTSSDSSLALPGSPGSPTDMRFASSLVRHKSDGIAVVKSRTWAPPACAGLVPGVSPRQVPSSTAPASPRASLRKTLVHPLRHVGSARCVSWHPVSMTSLHHTFTVC